MSKYTYEIIEHWTGEKTLLRSDGTHIPMVQGNADYENYLNPKAEQSTPSLT
jgi:hypothetical protein